MSRSQAITERDPESGVYVSKRLIAAIAIAVALVLGWKGHDLVGDLASALSASPGSSVSASPVSSEIMPVRVDPLLAPSPIPLAASAGQPPPRKSRSSQSPPSGSSLSQSMPRPTCARSGKREHQPLPDDRQRSSRSDGHGPDRHASDHDRTRVAPGRNDDRPSDRDITACPGRNRREHQGGGSGGPRIARPGQRTEWPAARHEREGLQRDPEQPLVGGRAAIVPNAPRSSGRGASTRGPTGTLIQFSPSHRSRRWATTS